MKRTATPTFVLSIPLVVKPGEDRILIGRMEAGRRLYNATLGEALRRHGFAEAVQRLAAHPHHRRQEIALRRV
ncbi:MAG: hypothetical protein HO273_00355 [Ferrovum myxofaciens]|uniref:hypothetical protein n=1 Tax=Ferrovum myxofaciens TaxID=416213 RepID=UPI001AF9C92B|nr:hypothetical protein [Ferrovum myxofaciens]QKE37366.1 MAG: hypothetical protein HO273_00355 [Ferrovum myxofaciens]